MIRLAPPTMAEVVSPACSALQAISKHVSDDEHAVLSVMLRFSLATSRTLNVLAQVYLARKEAETYSPGALEIVFIRHLVRKQIVSIASDSTAG